MICCKIIADYMTNPQGNLTQLLENLSKSGDFLLQNAGVLYFGNTDDDKVDYKKVSSIMRRAGYKNFFISEFNKDNQPREGDYLNAWISDRLMKINYKLYERQSQEVFKNVSKGLDILDDEIRELIKTPLQQEQEQGQGAQKEEEGQV